MRAARLSRPLHRLHASARVLGNGTELSLEFLFEVLEIAVCHLPSGTSKWNKIEHRLFSAISQNWRGKPLVSHEVVVNLIGATTTTTL